MSNYTTIQMEQGTPEWHAFRRNHIGASDAPIIMNQSPWRTPYQLWQEKVGLGQDRAQTRAMRRGIQMEEEARQKYVSFTGEKVYPLVAKSSQYPFMIASLDGANENKILEIKCPGDEDHQLALQGKIPKKYLYQLIQQMLVMQREEVDYFSYSAQDDFALITISLSDFSKEVQELVLREKEFWDKVQKLEEPELMKADLMEQDSVEWNLTAGEYHDIRKKLRIYEADEKRCRERLLQLAEGSNSRGGGIRVTKHVRKGTVDYARIPELEGLDLDQYRKEASSYWKIALEE